MWAQGAINATKLYEFIGFGTVDVTKPYDFIRFGSLRRSATTLTGSKLASSLASRLCLVSRAS